MTVFYIIAQTKTFFPAGLFTSAVDASSILPPDQDSGSLLNKLFCRSWWTCWKIDTSGGWLKTWHTKTLPRISVRMCPSVDVLCSHLSKWLPMSHLLPCPACRELLPPLVLPWSLCFVLFCSVLFLFHFFCDLQNIMVEMKSKKYDTTFKNVRI